MHLTAQHRKIIAVVAAVAVVAAMIPAVLMIGCTMPMTKMLCDFGDYQGAALSQTCGGTWITTHGPAATASAGLSTLLFALALAFVASVSMFFASTRRLVMVPVRIEPPPPLDPLGERLTV